MPFIHSMGAMPEAEPVPVRLNLLGDFALTVNEEPVTVPQAEQRLLAHLACADRLVSRGGVVNALWPDADPIRARANLRTCLWRIKRLGRALVRSFGDGVRLDPGVGLDLREGTALARDVVEGRPRDVLEHVRLLEHDLLPCWFDEWLDPCRDAYRRLRVQALEEAARRLLKGGRPAGAVTLAAKAVEAEPLRDGAHWLLVRALAAEGNHGAAADRYRRYARMLETELGVPVPLTLAEILRRGD